MLTRVPSYKKILTHFIAFSPNYIKIFIWCKRWSLVEGEVVDGEVVRTLESYSIKYRCSRYIHCEFTLRDRNWCYRNQLKYDIGKIWSWPSIDRHLVSWWFWIFRVSNKVYIEEWLRSVPMPQYLPIEVVPWCCYHLQIIYSEQP